MLVDGRSAFGDRSDLPRAAQVHRHLAVQERLRRGSALPVGRFPGRYTVRVDQVVVPLQHVDHRLAVVRVSQHEVPGVIEQQSALAPEHPEHAGAGAGPPRGREHEAGDVAGVELHGGLRELFPRERAIDRQRIDACRLEQVRAVVDQVGIGPEPQRVDLAVRPDCVADGSGKEILSIRLRPELVQRLQRAQANHLRKPRVVDADDLRQGIRLRRRHQLVPVLAVAELVLLDDVDVEHLFGLSIELREHGGDLLDRRLGPVVVLHPHRDRDRPLGRLGLSGGNGKRRDRYRKRGREHEDKRSSVHPENLLEHR